MKTSLQQLIHFNNNQKFKRKSIIKIILDSFKTNNWNNQLINK